MQRMKYTLPETIKPRDYQVWCLNQARNLITVDPDTWHLFSSPTGTGKSIAEWLLLANIPDSVLITPRIEIIAGMMEKLDHYVEDLDPTALIDLSWKYGITTPVRLRSLLSKGLLRFMPSCLIIDEAHHDFAQTYQDIAMYLNGCPKIGLTATPYRGTPKGTEGFLKQWGNKVHKMLELSDAIRDGYCVLPEPTVWPLLDDDTMDISNGEFKLNSGTATQSIQTTMDALVERVKPFYCKRSKLWDKATMFSVPTTIAAKYLQEALTKSNLPASIVVDGTTRKQRVRAFADCVNCSTALVQINVVSEGVDLPIRRLIDASPTMSPVKWIQQVGRIMRPSEDIAEYICCCRNLERHCYLMEGLFPNNTVKDAQEAFGEEGVPLPSRRSGTRVIGLEGLGKFTTTPVYLMDGTVAFLYNLVHTAGYQRTEYIALLHPNHPEPIKGMKVSANDGENMKWGRWKLVDTLPDLKGCISAKVGPLTEKQQIRWNESAAEYGLNPHRTINTREFQVLPFLRDCNLRFRV